MRRLLAVLFLSTAFSGCGSKAPESANIPLDQMPAATGEVLTGTVLEQIAAPPYLYLRLKTAQGEAWAAVSGAAPEKGAEVSIANPILMKKFESTALKRVFDEIYFGELASAGAAASGSGADPHAAATQPAATVEVGKVEKAAGADARTVAEAWTQKSRLNGKTVTIRGVVVKVTEGVMGKNWIHLQDGSGDAAQKTNDITVTSTDLAAAGETVTVTGTLRTDRDIGAGYVFAVLIEDAKVVKK